MLNSRREREGTRTRVQYVGLLSIATVLALVARSRRLSLAFVAALAVNLVAIAPLWFGRGVDPGTARGARLRPATRRR